MNLRPTIPCDALKLADCQPFNSLDIALLTVDQTIRGMGYPGFETQMLIWLSGRVDVVHLRRAIERLARRHPALTSRLVECDDRGGFAPRWQFQPDLAASLNEIELPSGDSQGVLDCAADLLSVPRVPAREPPLSFHLLHRPDGGDVLLLQYDHALMDNAAVPLLVRELDRPGNEFGDEDTPQAEPRRRAARRLHSLSHSERRAATLAAIQLQAHALRGRAAILGTGEEDKPRNVKLRIAARAIEPAVMRAINARSIKLCGIPSVSMSILGSTFRAICRHSPASRNADRNYVAGVGLDLGLRQGGQVHVQNLGTIVPITARPQELADRDQLIRSLSRQIRDRLEARIDLGMLRLAHVFQRRPRHIRWVTDHMLRWSYSLWYAYFGSLDAIRTLGNVPVERVQFVGPVWSPIGISLLANQYRGRLLLQLTFDPDLVTPSLAEAFLDTLCTDLTELASEDDRL